MTKVIINDPELGEIELIEDTMTDAEKKLIENQTEIKIEAATSN